MPNAVCKCDYSGMMKCLNKKKSIYIESGNSHPFQEMVFISSLLLHSLSVKIYPYRIQLLLTMVSGESGAGYHLFARLISEIYFISTQNI